MSSVVIHGHTFKTKISSSEIQKAVAEVAKQINKDLKGKQPLFLAVLNGSFMFAADLMKKVNIECEISFVKVASYEGTSSTGKIKQLIGLNEEIKGRTVVTVALDGGQNAGILAVQILGAGNDEILKKVIAYKENLKNKILKANKELSDVKFEFKTN